MNFNGIIEFDDFQLKTFKTYLNAQHPGHDFKIITLNRHLQLYKPNLGLEIHTNGITLFYTIVLNLNDTIFEKIQETATLGLNRYHNLNKTNALDMEFLVNQLKQNFTIKGHNWFDYGDDADAIQFINTTSKKSQTLNELLGNINCSFETFINVIFQEKH